MRLFGAVVGAAAALLCQVFAKPALGIKGGKVSVTSPDGISDATYTLKEPTPLPTPIHLAEGSTFKLTFTIVDTESSSGVFPQQAHLLFESKDGDVTLPLTVKAGGKAGFTINTAKPPPALLSTLGDFNLTLLLSSGSAYTPLLYPLGSVSLPPAILRPLERKRHDLPPRQGEPAFQPQQEIFHTFQPEEKTVSWVYSAAGTVACLAPWLLLLALISRLSPELHFVSPPSTVYPFLACLVAIEALTATYWVGLRLYQFLPWFLGLSAVAAYTGKVALGSLRQQRLAAGGKP